MILPHVSAVTQPHLWGLLHFFRWCAWGVAWSSAINSVLPCEDIFDDHPAWKHRYLQFVTINSFFALNLRRDQPSVGVLPIWGRKGRTGGR